MKIMVLAHGLRAGGGVVVGQNLTAELIAARPSVQWTVLAPAGMGYSEALPELPAGRLVELDFRSALHRFYFDHFVLPSRVRRQAPDLLLALGNIGLARSGTEQAVFLHQSQLVYPARHYGQVGIRDRARYAYLKWRFRRQLPTTSTVFVQTPVMRDRLVQTYNYTGRVEVIGTAVDRDFSDKTTGLQPANTDGPFTLLCLTRYYTHKNLELLVRTFERYSEVLHDVRIVLTIEAGQHRNARALLEAIETAGLQDQIQNIGPVKQSDLAKVYADCNAVLIPTLLESFGITYLEAMLAAKPVITSDLDFARFQCGDAALYFDPWSDEDLLSRILQLKNDPALQESLIASGRDRLRASQVSWNDVAKIMLEKIDFAANERQNTGIA